MTTEALLRLALETSLRVTTVAALVALVLLAARVRSSSVKHAAWAAVLGAMVLMPVLPYCVPSVAVSVPAPALRSVDALTEFMSPFDRPPGLGDALSNPEPVRFTVAPASGGQDLPGSVRVVLAARPIWPAAVAGVYALGFVLLASRLLLGWRRARRLVKNRPRGPVSIQTGPKTGLSAGNRSQGSVFESALVVTPLTVGVLTPRIILPTGWRAWPAEKLRAVLAHERAHIARRDPLIAFVAAVNRCVFWFHPLAWWLERKLAAMAEHACDEAVVRELGERRSAAYAEVLLDMAEAARRAGGRLRWQGVGVVNGTSLISRRIDRILKGDLLREISRTRKIVVALASAAAIFIVVACRQQVTVAAAPLKEDPEITARFAAQRAYSEFYRKAGAMSASQIELFQAQWDKNPEDIEAARTLLTAYEPVHNGVRVATPAFVLKRRAIMLWLIAHHPDHYLAARSPWIIGAGDDTGAGKDEALRLWQAAVAKPDVNVKTLSNAAYFFATVDRALAEQTLLRAQAMEPGGGRWVVDDYLGVSSPWAMRLADLYAQAVSGMKVGLSVPNGLPMYQFDLNVFNGGFAQEVRKKLDAGKDAALLGNVASALMRRTIYPEPPANVVNPMALAERYAKRALELDPNEPTAHSVLATVRRYELNQGRFKLNIGFWSTESHTAKVAALSPAERFAVLADLADDAYMGAEYNDFESKRKDAEYPNKWFKTREEREQAALSAWAQSKQFAREALDLAPRFKDAPNYSSTIYRANIVLGLHVLREGEVRAAVGGMRAALTAPPSEQLAYDPTGGLDARLVNYLLNCGERESVADFLERSAQLIVRDREQRLKDAAAIRKGQMPSGYQYMVTPH